MTDNEMRNVGVKDPLFTNTVLVRMGATVLTILGGIWAVFAVRYPPDAVMGAAEGIEEIRVPLALVERIAEAGRA